MPVTLFLSDAVLVVLVPEELATVKVIRLDRA